MDVLSHTFLPLIFLLGIGRLSKRHIMISPASLLPDLDKLFLTGLLHSLLVISPVLLAIAAAERKLKGNLETSLILSFFVLSHVFLDILDGGPVPVAYPAVSLGFGISYNAKIFVSNLTVSDIFPSVEIREISPSESYELFSGFGLASAIIFFMILIVKVIKSERC